MVESYTKEALKAYKDQLVKYRKFCLLRLERINIRISLDGKDDNLTLSKFEENYLFEDKETFFSTFERSIFEAELGLLINNSENDSLQSIEDSIQKFERSFADVSASDDSLYYSRDIVGKVLLETLKPTRSDALSLWAKRKYKGYQKKDKESTVGSLQKVLKTNCRKLPLFNGAPYTIFIYDISTKYQREILNAIFSQIINVDNSNATVIQKRDNRPLLYFELRLLVYLRNPYCDSDKFIPFAEGVLREAKNDNSVENTDYKIIEILYILISKVKDPEKVDSLILVHKLVNGLWKNGSKFLHFYTLHNEEHSIALIKNTIKMVNTIDYLVVKKLDYYILFLACYLHDISMVIHPNMNSFCSDSTSSDIIYSEWIESMSKFKEALQCEPKSNIKKHIVDYFDKVYNHFENTIRTNHEKESAAFIKLRSNSPFLEFIDNSILQIVADISESHGYDDCEVYGRKSHAKSELYSMKYMMILIRFADLLDIAKDRVSYYILKENIAHMSPIAQFHWVSHYVTDRCEFKATYESKLELADENERWLAKGAIKELVQFDLYLNTKQLTTPVNSGCECGKYVNCKHDLPNNMLTITIPDETKDGDKRCNAEHCTLLCKWMTTKHEYLFNEIHALVKYLSTVNSGLYTTDVVVNIHYDNKRVLDSEMMDSVVKYLN